MVINHPTGQAFVRNDLECNCNAIKPNTRVCLVVLTDRLFLCVDRCMQTIDDKHDVLNVYRILHLEFVIFPTVLLETIQSTLRKSKSHKLNNRL